MTNKCLLDVFKDMLCGCVRWVDMVLSGQGRLGKSGIFWKKKNHFLFGKKSGENLYHQVVGNPG